MTQLPDLISRANVWFSSIGSTIILWKWWSKVKMKQLACLFLAICLNTPFKCIILRKCQWSFIELAPKKKKNADWKMIYSTIISHNLFFPYDAKMISWSHGSHFLKMINWHKALTCQSHTGLQNVVKWLRPICIFMIKMNFFNVIFTDYL